MDKTRRPHTEKAKERIRAGHILRRLLEHFDGKLELSQTQITVGMGLLKKVLPDLKSIENTGSLEIVQSVINAQPELTTEEWQDKHESPTVN